ncbi:hypothetical protein [Flectobacillus roseus]|uniref:hypothetical protein n=1 Tax=Flectobacillus roseus TaxID=502259 RepID=UPI0024B86836|nr:hypothetical protein [Flectobacillus roseus]MDI9870556.1 hypothetical protein [Flectobacillus roseus]
MSTKKKKKKKKDNHTFIDKHNRPIQSISKDFNSYKLLLSELKEFEEEVITLEQPGNNAKYIKGKSKGIHTILGDEILLEAELKASNYTSIRLKLFSKERIVEGVPFFRFESDGPAHFNNIPGSDLQLVQTPHFHKYESCGQYIAYRPNGLSDDNTAIQVLTDIDSAITVFCQESNLKTTKNNELVVNILPSELPLSQIQDDPNANHSF